MKTEVPKKVVKMMWDLAEMCKTTTVQNIITAAKANDIKLTHADLQKISYIVTSSCEQVSMNSTRNFENQITEMVANELALKSPKAK